LKPVAIFRFARTEGAGHFATFLAEHGREFRLVHLDEGEPVPGDASGFAGLGFMGGPMSANDELAWTQPVLALMRDAVAKDVPVIGHCLGGQLLARSLGGRVSRNPVIEIGWVPVSADPTPAAREWLGGLDGFDAFEWHYDTFTIPPGGERILAGATCANQAFVVGGRHLGMQCHVEVNAEMIDTWCGIGADEISEHYGKSPAGQDAVTIRTELTRKLAGHTATASALYARWMRGLQD
jgi:GMP synthase-like glutamine amidotransferase